MDLLHCIKNRRSIRNYSRQPVEFDKITAVIEAGHYAPSAGNLQDWKFIIITDAGLRKSIANHCMEQYWMEKATAMIVVISDTAKCERHYGLRGKRLYTVQSTAACIENMLLTAHAIGLGACWVGSFDEDFLSSTLNIPEENRPQAIITLGYPDEVPEEKELTALDGCTFFNTYGNRIDKPHLVLRDYSIEWEKQSDKVRPVILQGIDKLKEGANKLKKQIDEQRSNNQPNKNYNNQTEGNNSNNNYNDNTPENNNNEDNKTRKFNFFKKRK